MSPILSTMNEEDETEFRPWNAGQGQITADPAKAESNGKFVPPESTDHHVVHIRTKHLAKSHLTSSNSDQNLKEKNKSKTSLSKSTSNSALKRPATPPAEKVQFLLGTDNTFDDDAHEPHPLFAEMEELCLTQDGELAWKETARWVKFEENVEDGGNRWSKPHVATLTLHSLFELRGMLNSGSVMLDMYAKSLEDIADLVLDHWINKNYLYHDQRGGIRELILKTHSHHHEKNKHRGEARQESLIPIIRSLADIGRRFTDTGANNDSQTNASFPRSASTEAFHKANTHFKKKIPKNAEASSILVGETNLLEKPLVCFIRLSEASYIGDLTEVEIPTRFVFLLLGPANAPTKSYHEIGRSVATIMCDEVFQDVAYKARKTSDLLAGIDEFLDSVTVLPPGEWDPSIRIEPPNSVPSQDSRKRPPTPPQTIESEQEIIYREKEKSGLIRSNRLFGGLINDLKRKLPWYFSDYKDALSIQCVASFIFIYFGVLAPVITFGGLLGEATEDRISVIEALVGGMIVGMCYGLFSGQPLSILGPTGPVLVFETIVYDLCTSFGWAYLSFRFWIGLWVALILLILVATDASVLVCYITRFTEENFATLIGVIFIKSAIEKILAIGQSHPIHEDNCICIHTGSANDNFSLGEMAPLSSALASTQKAFHCFFEVDGNITNNYQDEACHVVPNVYMTSILLFCATYMISTFLKQFKNANYFPTIVRAMVSDFAVIIALFTMTILDAYLNVDTPKLFVPSSFTPTWSGRSWVIDPFGGNPWWTAIVAFAPALLATILIFMDQQITVVIVNRKENLLQKGCGFHLDLFVVALMIIVCSVFGFPWCEASTVPSIIHVQSLKMESESTAPGEKPQFLGVREQRATHVLAFLLIGLSVFMAPVLGYIPMPVLFGVFLYMGTASINGLQLVDRISLFFMPKKFQPDLPYLRRIPLKRVHLFTLIQILCLAALWVIKDIKQTSILFPIMLVVMVGVRKALERLFHEEELRILDDVFPSFKRSKQLDEEELREKTNDVISLRLNDSGNLEVPIPGGKVLSIPMDKVNQSDRNGFNISEEMNKSSLWLSLEGSQVNLTEATSQTRKRRNKSERKRSKTANYHPDESPETQSKDVDIEGASPERNDDHGIVFGKLFR
eukprot:maker-scaffold154_size301342-snap-gene-2.21 protein:Tk07769 transcript:maker-scaffold154_size301342-snap-gene-2.21-mRNA-1 annotation:"sodium-driven chloride bicarbonate exchanger-like isoform x17"